MAITMSVRRPGRTILVAIALFSLVAGTLVVRAIREPARATSSGSPYDVPLAVDTNPNPNVFETTITAQVATVDLGTGSGATVKAFTFNGTVPGPEIRIKPNDTVIVHFKNQLPAGQKTGIHWHGVELNNRSDGTAVTQNAVPPGGEYLYKFIAPRPGIFWYHPHHHLSTNQVFKGMYGSLIVADPNETTLQNNSKLPPQSETRTLVLSDTTVCKGAPEDTNTYNPGVPAFQSQPPPWSGFGAFPGQGGPTPEKLCKTPLNDDGIITATPLAAGDIPNIQVATAAGSIPVVEGQTVLTNGKNVGARGGSPTSPGALAPGASTLPVRAGQGVRFQVVNAATTRYMRLQLTTTTGTPVNLFRVGGEGGLLDLAVLEGGVVPDVPHANNFDFKYAQGEILVPPGDRADIVAAIPTSATGTLTLWTLDFQRTGGGFANIPTVPVAHLAVSGSQPIPYTISQSTLLRGSIPGQSVAVLPLTADTLLDPATFAPVKDGKAAPLLPITITATPGGPTSIDGIAGEHNESFDYTVIPKMKNARYARIGDILQLTARNSTGAHHPFHLHGFSIQPLALIKDGGAGPDFAVPFREFRDEFDIPPTYTLVFRVELKDRPLADGVTPGGGLGRWLIHCHIFFHHSLGMLSELIVLPRDVPQKGNEKPYLDANSVSTSTAFGGLATMAGTVMDPDFNPPPPGEAVTLTASVGSVVNNGDGTWAWSYAPAAVPQFVYITGTDPFGHKSQAVFELKIVCSNNVTGLQPTSLTLTSGTWCIKDATITGSVTVNPGASAIISNSSIGGNLSGTSGPGAVLVCGSTVTGQTMFLNATGFILLGDTQEFGCAGNSLRNVTLTGNKSGIEVSDNSLIDGSLTVNSTTGAGPFPDNVAPAIENNPITGALSCSGNAVNPTNNGRPNSVSGTRSGQCAAL